MPSPAPGQQPARLLLGGLVQSAIGSKHLMAAVMLLGAFQVLRSTSQIRQFHLSASGTTLAGNPPISATCNDTHEIRGDPAASLLAQTAPCPTLPCPSAQFDFSSPWVLASASDNDFQKVIHPQTTRPVSPGPISLLSSWPDSRLRLDSRKQLARVCLSRATTGHSLQSLFTSGDRARSHWFELFYHRFISSDQARQVHVIAPTRTVVIPRLFAPAIRPSGHRASPRPFTTADHARRSYLTLIAVRHWSTDGQSGQALERELG